VRLWRRDGDEYAEAAESAPLAATAADLTAESAWP